MASTEQPAKRLNFVQDVWSRLEIPIAEIVVHAIVTILSVLSIALTERTIHLVGLDAKVIPHTPITLSEWMFYFEILAATLINLIGIAKAVAALVRS